MPMLLKEKMENRISMSLSLGIHSKMFSGSFLLPRISLIVNVFLSELY